MVHIILVIEYAAHSHPKSQQQGLKKETTE